MIKKKFAFNLEAVKPKISLGNELRRKFCFLNKKKKNVVCFEVAVDHVENKFISVKFKVNDLFIYRMYELKCNRIVII